jgi:hypothetical protein
MANPDVGRITLRPSGSMASQSLQPESLPLESEPPSFGIASDDFLYHLSRGSELLKENQVEPAKEALELALRMQPQDIRGQGLLGVVYFRLGLYPRAIDIYQKIILACPDEIAPKVNLALCYVKTGQQIAARDLLQEVVQREPSHLRAWAYLGLVFQFLHDFEKAQAAFERAGQQGMVERMKRLSEQNENYSYVDEGITNERWELRAAVHDAYSELDSKNSPFRVAEELEFQPESRSGRWHATEPGEEAIPEIERTQRRPSTPPPALRTPSNPTVVSGELSMSTRGLDTLRESIDANSVTNSTNLREWFSSHAPATQPQSKSINVLDERSVLIELSEPFGVRANSVVLVMPAIVASREMRILVRSREPDLDVPLGGGQAPIVGYRGPGRLLARTDQGVVEVVELVDETLTVRESALWALSLNLNFEADNLRFSRVERLDVIRITGQGVVLLALPLRPRAVDITEGGLLIRASDVVGWTARVLPVAVDPAESPGRARGYLSFTGNGHVLLGQSISNRGPVGPTLAE